MCAAKERSGWGGREAAASKRGGKRGDGVGGRAGQEGEVSRGAEEGRSVGTSFLLLSSPATMRLQRSLKSMNRISISQLSDWD